jgi:hypothetical protein
MGWTEIGGRKVCYEFSWSEVRIKVWSGWDTGWSDEHLIGHIIHGAVAPDGRFEPLGEPLSFWPTATTYKTIDLDGQQLGDLQPDLKVCIARLLDRADRDSRSEA